MAASLALANSEHVSASQDERGAVGEISAFESLTVLLQGDALESAIVLTSAPARFALADHLARVLGVAGRVVVRGQGSTSIEGFLDVERSLVRGVSVARGRGLADRIRSLEPEGSTFVVVDENASAFSRTVFADLVKAGAKVVWILGEQSSLEALTTSLRSVRRFDVGDALNESDARKWWQLAAGTSGPHGGRSLATLEDWWRGARALSLRPDGRAAVAPLVERLRLVGRAVHVSTLERLAQGLEASAVESLDSDASVERSGEWIFARPDAAGVDAISTIDASAADAVLGLLDSPAADAWALLRGAEVAYACGRIERADSLAMRALTNAHDASVRGAFWERVLVAAKPLVDASRAGVLSAWTEVALGAGDADVALSLARQLCDVQPSPSSRDVLLLGRASAATGDLASATSLLERVTRAADVGPLLKARAAVELAEARYFSHDLGGAAAAASAALEVLGQASTEATASEREARALVLDARNVQGKLHLANAAFDEADRHFVADACEAAILGERSLELRARANRAIAVMSQGRRSEAQAMLEAVLRDAEEIGELRAIGIALINLAPLAIFDHRYMDALELSERSVQVLRRIGDRVRLARVVSNLAELRLRLGLVDEAAHAIRFASPTFRGGPPAERVWQSSLILARVALAKGDTAGAQRFVNEALAAVGAANILRVPPGDPALAQVARGPVNARICDALLVGARAALDDGDVVRAELFTARADADRVPPRSAASVTLCRAQLARAKGETFIPVAVEALQAARELDDDELLIEAHLLLHHGYLQSGSRSSAKHHIDAAMVTRDRVALPLSDELRKAFLSRRDLVELAEAERVFLDAARQETLSSAVDEPLSWDRSPREMRGPSTIPSRADGRADAGEKPMFVGNHPTMKTLQAAVRKVGPSESTVLIHGESGTGKELVAEALHKHSQRAAGPLVKVNCAALVETLLLSELFGYEKGAFTGAANRRRGRFEAAEGGTLFLDEIGDISARTQVALLRVLQEKTFERVGGNTTIRADVRIVCATHRDLKSLVEAGLFREDLYYRLCGIVLQVPALRKRRSDLGALSTVLLRRIGEERGTPVKNLSQRALLALGTHTWPGNVRELENALRAASLFADGAEIELADFIENVESLRYLADVAPPSLSSGSMGLDQAFSGPLSSAGPELAQSSSVGSSLVAAPSVPSLARVDAPPPSGSAVDVAYAAVRGGISLHDMKRTIERDCIARALTETSGNITRAAAVLGMKRPRLSQLVKQYELGAANDSSGDDGELDSAAAEEE